MKKRSNYGAASGTFHSRVPDIVGPQSQPPTWRPFIHPRSFPPLNETRHLRPVRYKLWFFHMGHACVIVFPLSPLFYIRRSSLSRAPVREREGTTLAGSNTWGWKPVSRNRLSREAQKKHSDRGRNSISRRDNAFFRSRSFED